MNALRLLLAATALAFAASASGACYFDGASPDAGDDFVPNMKMSLGGDDCSVFRIAVGIHGEEQSAVLIPRAEIYDWQGCRFTNVITDHKVLVHLTSLFWDLYDPDAVSQDVPISIYGYCGKLLTESVAPDPDAEFEQVGDTVELELTVDLERFIDVGD